MRILNSAVLEGPRPKPVTFGTIFAFKNLLNSEEADCFTKQTSGTVTVDLLTRDIDPEPPIPIYPLGGSVRDKEEYSQNMQHYEQHMRHYQAEKNRYSIQGKVLLGANNNTLVLDTGASGDEPQDYQMLNLLLQELQSIFPPALNQQIKQRVDGWYNGVLQNKAVNL